MLLVMNLKICVFPMCMKSVFESINSIRHNDIVSKAIPHVYDRITEKILPQLVSTSLRGGAVAYW